LGAGSPRGCRATGRGRLAADGDIAASDIDVELVPNPARGVVFGITLGCDRTVLWHIVELDITLSIHELEAAASLMKRAWLPEPSR
jgi:hypothetical protein